MVTDENKKSDTVDKSKKWRKNLRNNLLNLSTLLQTKEGKSYLVLTKGWISITRKKTEEGFGISIFRKKQTRVYWGELRLDSDKHLKFVFFHTEKKLKQSKKKFNGDEIIEICWLQNEEGQLTSTLSFSTINVFCTVGRKPGSETRHVSLKWAASIIPVLQRHNPNDLIAEIYADHELAEHSESITAQLQEQVVLPEVIKKISKTEQKVKEPTPKPNSEHKTLLFFNLVKMSKIRLRLSVDQISASSSLPIVLTGTYSLNVPDFHLHSDLLTWQNLYRAYRYHALTGILKSFILPRRRVRSVSSSGSSGLGIELAPEAISARRLSDKNEKEKDV